MKKKDFQLALQLGFSVVMTICNSLATHNIFIGMNAMERVTWITMDTTHYVWNHVHMQLVQLNYNYVETTIV